MAIDQHTYESRIEETKERNKQMMKSTLVKTRAFNSETQYVASERFVIQRGDFGASRSISTGRPEEEMAGPIR